MDPVERQDHFDDFYEDVYREMSKHGKVECMHVCANEAEHMNGNMYVKFCDEEDAAEALKTMQAQTYEGRMLMPEFSPVTDFREATCRQHEEGGCKRGGFCNFMHLYKPSVELCQFLGLDLGGSRSRRGSRHRSSPRRRSPSPYTRKSYRRSPSPYSRRSRRRSPPKERERYSRREESREYRGRGRSRSPSPWKNQREKSREYRGRRRSRSPSPWKNQRDKSEERRAKIARWNMERNQRDR